MWLMAFGTTVGLELGLLLLCYREGLICDLWCLVLRQGLELGLLLLCYREGLKCDLWCLVLRWDRNWSYCCCVIGKV